MDQSGTKSFKAYSVDSPVVDPRIRPPNFLGTEPHLTGTLIAALRRGNQASAQQRKGRAGRTKAGVCFRMFSSTRFSSMREFVDSELLRTPLVSTYVLSTVSWLPTLVVLTLGSLGLETGGNVSSV